MSEQQRAQLFELWKRAPFPEIASAVDTFIQDAAARAEITMAITMATAD